MRNEWEWGWGGGEGGGGGHPYASDEAKGCLLGISKENPKRYQDLVLWVRVATPKRYQNKTQLN